MLAVHAAATLAANDHTSRHNHAVGVDGVHLLGVTDHGVREVAAAAGVRRVTVVGIGRRGGHRGGGGDEVVIGVGLDAVGCARGAW